MSTETETPQAPECANGVKTPPTKMEAAKLAYQTLGMQATPQEVIDYVQTHFGLEVKAATVGNAKKELKDGGATAPRSKPGRKPAAPIPTSAVAAPTTKEIARFTLLAHRLGREHVREILEALP